MSGVTKKIDAIMTLGAEMCKCSSKGREFAEGVHLARPAMNRAILTLDAKAKKGAKTVETVKCFNNQSACSSKAVQEKWQEVIEADGTVITNWRDPQLAKPNTVRGNQAMRYGWRKESPDGTIELFTDGAPADVVYNCSQGYPRELSYMWRQGDKSLIAIKDPRGLTIRAKDIQLDNGVVLNGRYHTPYPSDKSRDIVFFSKSPTGTDKGVLYDLFTSMNSFLTNLRRPSLQGKSFL